MAERGTDRDFLRRAPLWSWLATAAALLLVIGLIVWAASQEEEPRLAGRLIEPQPTATTGIEPTAVHEYLEFAGVIGDGVRPQPGREHEYTAEGLRKLADAIQALDGTAQRAARAGIADDIRSSADRIQRDPASQEHAKTVREAFLSAAQGIPDGADLPERARAISAEQPLLEQDDAIQDFFHASGRALRDASPHR